MLDTHMLGLECLINGRIPITPDLTDAVSQLTTLPETFFTQRVAFKGFGRGTLQDYLPALRIAAKFEISPEEVEDLLVSYAVGECSPRWRLGGARQGCS